MSLPIVGIGASAGGLESFSELLARVPAGTQQDIQDSGVCRPFPNAQILSGVRHPATLLIFTADDSTAKDSALETLEFFGDAADYLIIENSSRFKSDSFKATPLYDEFVARNSPTLAVPRISAGTLNAWEAAQASNRRNQATSSNLCLSDAGDRFELGHASFGRTAGSHRGRHFHRSGRYPCNRSTCGS